MNSFAVYLGKGFLYCPVLFKLYFTDAKENDSALYLLSNNSHHALPYFQPYKDVFSMALLTLVPTSSLSNTKNIDASKILIRY